MAAAGDAAGQTPLSADCVKFSRLADKTTDEIRGDDSAEFIKSFKFTLVTDTNVFIVRPVSARSVVNRDPKAFDE